MDDTKLRAWWWHRQGLDGSMEGRSPSEVLERAGWSRSVGGVGPYLALFARAGTSREEADQAVATLQIHELPTARGCTYVVPASDFALGLKVGQRFEDNEMKTAVKLGVTEKEVDKLCDAVLAALGREPLDPDAIRQATGTASRSLGEAGKKKGLTTTLPLALGRLQGRGEIRRVPVNGRLDQQRYRYAVWKPSPLARYKATLSESYTELARRFFRWNGPTTLGEFAWFSALGVKASKEAVEPLTLVPAEENSNRLLLPEDVDAFRRFKAPNKPQYALVSGLDPLALGRELQSLLDPRDYSRKFVAAKGTAPGSALKYLETHAIFDRGRLVGAWEYDPEAQAIVWASFGIEDKALDAAVKKTETYVREQLGDARSFSLDSPKSRKPRIDALRKMK